MDNPPPINWPAIWSAIAAFGSAAAAWLTFLIHRGNRADAIRPELVLLEAAYSVEGDIGRLSFGKLKNVGRGVALYIDVMSLPEDRSPAVSYAFEQSRDIIAPNEVEPITFSVLVNWHQVTRDDEKMEIVIWIRYFDIEENAYNTQYEFTLSKGLEAFIGMTRYELVPGVAFRWRSSAKSSRWRIKGGAIFRRVRPGLRSGWAYVSRLHTFRDVG
jgi:hypothetical protein